MESAKVYKKVLAEVVPFQLDSMGEELLRQVLLGTVGGMLVWRRTYVEGETVVYLAEYKRYGFEVRTFREGSELPVDDFMVTRLTQGFGKVEPDVKEVLLYVSGKDMRSWTDHAKIWGDLMAAVLKSAEKSRGVGVQEMLGQLRRPGTK